MDLKEIKSILRMMDDHHLVEFSLERKGERLLLRKAGADTPPAVTSHVVVPNFTAPPAPAPAAPAPAAAPAEPAEETGVQVIASPMVGTFYAAASPESRPYVSIGAAVAPESVVCIIEAMKIMNEIKAEVSGTITQVCVKNGQSVEFGQPLFKVKVE